MDDTVLFIHRGESWYLYYAVKQARAWHPAADIVVISDCPQRDVAPYARVLDMAAFWSGAAAFAEIYEHHSTNPHGFELFCFQRWFITEAFVRLHHPRRLVHLDSDLLVYADLFSDFARLGSADLALVGHQGPFSLMLPDPELVGRFCQRIHRLYSEEKPTLAAMYQEWRKNGAEKAISDMHALHTFVEQEGLEVVDLGIPHEGSAYDSVVHESDGYELENGCKKLTWRGGQPYATRLADGAAVRLKTLHCQGKSKARMLEFFTARDRAYVRDRLRAKLRAATRKWLSAVPGHRGGTRAG